MLPIMAAQCCPCGLPAICWQRYVSGATENLSATAPTPLGGHTESSPGSGTFSDLWTVVTGAATPYSTDNIHITGAATFVVNTITVDTTSVRFSVLFDALHNGDLPAIFFDAKADGSEWLKLEFECTDGFPALGLYKHQSGTTTKVRRFENDASGVSFDGTASLELRASLCRGALLCQLGSFSAPGDPNVDESGTKPKVGGVFVGDHDDITGVERPLKLWALLPILASDTATAFANDRWGVGGTPAGDPFNVTAMDVWNTDHLSADGNCLPDQLCGGMLCEYPVQIPVTSSNVVTAGAFYTRCDTMDTQAFASDPGAPWQLSEECDCTLSNTTVVTDWSPVVTGIHPNFCRYLYSNSDTPSCTIHDPCGMTADVPDSPSAVSELELLSNGVSANFSYAGVGPIVGTFWRNVGRFWKPSDVEGLQLPAALIPPAPNDPNNLCGYDAQRIDLGTFIFQDSD